MALSRIRVVIGADPPGRLDKALARDVPEEAHLSRTRLAALIAAGRVTRDDTVVADPTRTPQPGEAYDIAVPDAAPTETRAEAIPLAILFEDDDLIVVDKPAGLVVHPSPGTPTGTLVNALLAYCGDRLSGVGGALRPGIVHRIDKDTSGLLVVAKSDRAHHGLAQQFAAHTVERSYLAVCHGCPTAADPRLGGIEGVAFEPGGALCIRTRLARHRTDRQRQAVVRQGGRLAVTRARVTEAFGTPPAAALLECRLETGRTHQIRVHLAHVGHALIGDPVYGGRRRLPGNLPGAERAAAFPRQALHAATLGFLHPIMNETMRFHAPLPKDMDALITTLRG